MAYLFVHSYEYVYIFSNGSQSVYTSMNINKSAYMFMSGDELAYTFVRVVRLLTKARAPFMRSYYIRVTVVFESLHGLIEKMNTLVTRKQLQKRSHITASVLIRFI